MTKKKLRLTTDNPSGNYEMLHNCTTVHDKEVYLKDFDAEHKLIDFINNQCREICNVGFDGEDMLDCDCIVARFNSMAIGHAELRHRLKEYEDKEEVQG